MDKLRLAYDEAILDQLPDVLPCTKTISTPAHQQQLKALPDAQAVTAALESSNGDP